MLVIGAKRGHPPPAHLMDSLAPCVHLVNTAPQVLCSFNYKETVNSHHQKNTLLLCPVVLLIGCFDVPQSSVDIS